MIDMDSSTASTYGRDRYVVLPELLSQDVLDVIVAYAHILGSTERFVPDAAVGNALSRYGAPGFDALLVSLLHTASTIAATELVPSYSYARVYRKGDELKRHRDRPACQHSMTIHLDSSGGEWPVAFENLDGTIAAYELRPGDGVMYHGIELPHWRDPCPVDWYIQVFLHWVDPTGIHAEHAFDGRRALGLASERVQRIDP